jgi:DNA-binding response OmpR family regulator
MSAGYPRVVTDYLIATDAPRLFDELRSMLGGPGTQVRWVRSGHDVRQAANRQPPDLAILDMQIGTMGGIGVHFDIRLEIDAGRLESFPTLILLDRRADVFMARRSGVTGWLLKPLDPIRVRRATSELLAGGTYLDESYLPSPVAVPVVEETSA